MGASRRKKVSDAIRILQRKRDASARATHLKAEIGMVPNSTIERKIMSTKTSIKRIALVAAAALTLGGFSVITAGSANAAAAATATFQATSGYVYTSAAASTTDTATAVADGGHYVTVVLAAKTADQGYNVTTSGVGSLYGTVTTAGGSAGLDTLTANYTNGTNAAGGFLFTSTASPGAKVFSSSSATVTFTAISSASGTQTITATPINGTSAASTLTITWGAAPVFTLGTSTAFLNNVTNAAGAAGVDTATTNAADDSNVNASKTLGTVAGEIGVVLKDQNGAAINNLTVSASIAGAGLISIDTATSASTTGTSRSQSLVLDGTAASGHSAGATNKAWIHISADGTAGTGTVTITVTDANSVTTTLATKTVTFTGSIATVKASQNLYVLKAGGTTAGTGAGAASSSTDASAATTVAGKIAVVGYGLDSNGNPTAGTVKIVSSDSTVITAGSCTAVTVSSTVVAGTYNCAVTGTAGAASGKTATITFEAADANGNYTILSTPLTFTIGGAVASIALTTDASTYNALAPVKFTVAAKDSAGNLAYDQDAAFLSTVTSNIAMGGSLALAGVKGSLDTTTAMINGKATYSGFFAPIASGTLTVSALDALSTANEAVSVSASITGIGGGDASLALDAANAATDAANNAYDEAQNATQAASDALAAVKALAVQVKALIALVTKIKNKVGA